MADHASGGIAKCLIFGGRGFIGSHTVDALLACGVPIRVFGRPRGVVSHSYVDSIESPLLDIFEGDFNSESDLQAALEGCSHCINLITTTVPKNSNEDMVFDVQSNLIGTLNYLKHARAAGVAKTVYISSGGTVYGRPQYLPIDENHPTEPQSSYGITKLAAEKYLALHYQLFGARSTVLRVANPFGERQRAGSSQGAIAVFVAKALLNEPISIWGDGSVVRDYIYISDCVSAILAALDYVGPEQVFNVGSGVGTDLNQIVASIARDLGRHVDVVYEPSRSFDVSKSILNIEKARSTLGWSPRVDLQTGLRRTIAWFSEEVRVGNLRSRPARR